MTYDEFRPDHVLIRDFQFDERNLAHMRRKPGLDANRVWEVWVGEPVVFMNREGRSGTHMMVGPDAVGRVWTVILVLVDDEVGLWRPITGWPSVRKEIEAWRGGS